MSVGVFPPAEPLTEVIVIHYVHCSHCPYKVEVESQGHGSRSFSSQDGIVLFTSSTALSALNTKPS